MKTVLGSLAFGALFFAVSFRVVETRAQKVPRGVEDPPAAAFVVVEEAVEHHPLSRASVGKWKKPVVRVRDVEDHSFSRYGRLGLRPVAKPPVPARID